MTNDDPAENIRCRMAELRRDLEHDVREVERGARVVTDWKYYAGRYPWAVAGAALFAGYLLIPKRKPVIKPDPEMIQDLVRQKKIEVQSVTKQPEKPGVMKSLLMMGVTYAAKIGANYVTQTMADAARQKRRAATEPHEPGPSPLHEPWSATPG